MAEKKAPSELTTKTLREVFARAGEEEKELMRDLVRSDSPRQGAVLAEILHYFPGASLLSEED